MLYLQEKRILSSFFNELEEITPLPKTEIRPVWSVMIPTYNCAEYLRETLTSVLEQDLGAAYMQIEVVDDYSTKDDPEQVVKEVGKGRVYFYRQPQNVGHVRNFNTCIRRATGELVHILHGDDRVRVGFYLKLEALFRQYPTIGAAYCRFITMYENGQWEGISSIEESKSGLLSNSLIRLAKNQIVQPPAMVVRRAVYEQLRGYDQRLRYGEDWEMWVRIAANYPIGYETEPLAEYRNRRSSITGIFSRTGEDIRCTLQVIKIIGEYINDKEKRLVEKNARRFFGWYHRRLAIYYYNKLHDSKGAIAQLKGVIQMYKNPFFLFSLLRLYLKIKLTELTSSNIN
jgi:glycosyltransferase involved in cell wall biosynthesis